MYNPIHYLKLDIHFLQLENEKGYVVVKVSIISQVDSLGQNFLHYTLTCSIAQFQSLIFLLYSMQIGFGWNSPYGSTYSTYQSIT